MITELQKKEIILFGEIHNNPIAHWLQLELAIELNKSKHLILGAEMFESDNQEGLNLYLKDSIINIELNTMVRLWKNYKTDYQPLVDYAKSNDLPFIATNIPRRYAAMVHKNGGFSALDSLSIKEKSWIAPLPIPFDSEIPSYKAMLTMFAGHGNPDIIKAQASKDATMAYFILK
ncbi:ChaN family lipoprotein, partial [Flavobacteriales bacterium]|nr:ChaN family lipoprotein [Flavobacteriales bacterium]